MHMKHFGDGWDILKQALLQWLDPEDEWGVHPMFTHSVTAQEVQDYEAFLNARVLRAECLQQGVDRKTYLSIGNWGGHVFFDPDTGVKMGPPKQTWKSPMYIYGEELANHVLARPDRLTLVFDQSVPRGSEFKAVRTKLDILHSSGLLGIAYVAQAPFIVLTKDRDLIGTTHARLLANSKLPTSRVLQCY